MPAVQYIHVGRPVPRPHERLEVEPMGIIAEIAALREVAAEAGNRSLARRLGELQAPIADILRQLHAKDLQIAELERALRTERANRAPSPKGVLARRCPNWRALLHRTARCEAV
jgi:hypothetical protein